MKIQHFMMPNVSQNTNKRQMISASSSIANTPPVAISECKTFSRTFSLRLTKKKKKKKKKK